MINVDSIASAVENGSGHYIVETPITTLASGRQLSFTTHVLRGKQPGQTVGILSGLQGDEFSTAELTLSLLHRLSIDELAGTLLLIPMANTLSFEFATRSTPLDMANLNRVFPGKPNGTVTEMLAHALTEEFVSACDVVFDLHSEPDSMGIRCFYCPAPANDYGMRALELAKSSGSPIIFITDALAGTLAGTARDHGVLAVVPETGRPLPGAHGLMDEGQQELLKLLGWLGTIDGEIMPCDEQVVVDNVAHLRAPSGGLFRPDIGFDMVGRCVSKDELLGTIASTYRGETLAEIRAPFMESWGMMARGRVSRVHPGDPPVHHRVCRCFRVIE